MRRIVAVMRDRVTFISDFVEKCRYFYEPPATYDEEGVAKRWKPETPKLLQSLETAFAAVEGSDIETYEDALRRTAEALHVKPVELIHPLRIAVSGTTAGPGLYDILSILGKDETGRRIEAAIARIQR